MSTENGTATPVLEHRDDGTLWIRTDSPHVEIIREPLTYERYAPQSYFRDRVKAEQSDDRAAKERLERHDREIKVESERRNNRAWAAAPGDLEYRTNPNRTTGQGGYFSPPLWLIDQFATAPRAARVLANLIPGFVLPQGVQSVNVPRLTGGNIEVPVGDLAADPSQDATDAAVTSSVVTISGHGDVSLQALEQSPPGAHLDFAFFKDLGESYDAQLEAQLVSGSNTNGQLQGLLNVLPSANAVTYTAASPTGAGIYPNLGKAIAVIGDNRLRPPEAWLMRTARWAWIKTSEDTATMPFDLSIPFFLGSTRNTPDPIGGIANFPVFLDDAIPATLGAAANQDAIIACRPSDCLLFESDPRASVMLDVLSGTLQARIQLHRYVAALVGRYPSAVSAVQGTGLVLQSGF